MNNGDLQRFLQRGSGLENIQADLRHELAVQFERQMQASGLSIEQLAERTGAIPEFIADVLGGDVDMTLGVMARLAYGLGARIRITLEQCK